MQLTRFAIVGAAATLVQYAALVLMVEAMSVSKPLAAVFGYLAGGIVNYYLNLHWTFSFKGPTHEPVIRFVGVFVVGLMLTGLLMFFLATRLRINYVLSQILTTGVVFSVNYLLHKSWTFSNQRRDR